MKLQEFQAQNTSETVQSKAEDIGLAAKIPKAIFISIKNTAN